MDEYIKREAVHNLVRSLTKYIWTSPVRNEKRVTVDADDVQFGVDKVPAADVAPVRHGRWEWDTKGLYPKPLCSRCQYEPYRASNHSSDLPPYCPNCGAKMDLEEQT